MGSSSYELAARLDSSRWTKSHWQIFTSTSLGFLVWGFEATFGIVGYFAFHRLWFLIVWYAFDFIGDLVIPRISDSKLARKGTFYLTMSLMGVGLTVLTADIMFIGTRGLLPLVVGLIGGAIAKVGIEGDVPVSLSFLAENTPARYREASLVLAPNFSNLGSAVAALIAYLTYSFTNSTYYTALSVLVSSLAALAALAVVRGTMPESVRWLLSKGFRHRAEQEAKRLSSETEREGLRVVNPTVGIWGRYAFLVIIGIVQYLTFGLMAYVIAAYYYHGATAWLIVFYASLGATVAAFPAYWLAKRMDSRNFALLSYAGGFVSMIPIILYVLYFPTNVIAFYALLFLNMVFSEFGWAVRTILEPQLFPTETRATMIGLVRVFPMFTYDLSVYLTSSFTELQYVIFNAVMWLVGAIATGLWKVKGYDVRNALLESASAPSPKAVPVVQTAEQVRS